MKGLDAYIMGLNDPNAPFNHVEQEVVCQHCKETFTIEVPKNWSPEDEDNIENLLCEDCLKKYNDELERKNEHE